MHELSIAISLVEQVARAATDVGAVRVQAVEVRCGVWRQIVPEALQMGFEAAAAGTIVEGAELRLTEEALRVRCRACSVESAAEVDDYRCPQCGRADGILVAGRDVVLTAVECELADEAMADEATADGASERAADAGPQANTRRTGAE